MIIRIWSFKTPIQNKARFEEFEKKFGLPMLISLPGCRGVELIRRLPGPGTEFGMAEYSLITRWENAEKLNAALASKEWQEETELFLQQSFGEGNGKVVLYDSV